MWWSGEEGGGGKVHGQKKGAHSPGGYFFFSKCKQIICWCRSLQSKEESTYKACVKRQILLCEIEVRIHQLYWRGLSGGKSLTWYLAVSVMSPYETPRSIDSCIREMNFAFDSPLWLMRLYLPCRQRPAFFCWTMLWSSALRPVRWRENIKE